MNRSTKRGSMPKLIIRVIRGAKYQTSRAASYDPSPKMSISAYWALTSYVTTIVGAKIIKDNMNNVTTNNTLLKKAQYTDLPMFDQIISL